jgi:spermidine synthase
MGHGMLAAAVSALLAFATGPTAAWRHSPIGAGRVAESTIESSEAALSFVRDTRRGVEWEADGIESSVALHRNGGYAFTVNAKSDGHCRSDAGTQVMGGLLGALLHPSPASAMVIGLGTGSTAGWLASVPGVERVDVVELEPAMVEVARRCASVNEHALENPKLHIVRGDAREVLSVTRTRYDIVFSEPSNPYRAGVASLYTREYYRRVLERLGDGGLFLQWVQGYEIDRPTMRSVFATMASVFPHVEAWQLEEPDLLLVASRTSVVKDAGALRRRIAAEPFARALRVAWGVDDLEGVLAHFVARDSLATAIAEDSATERNTDDRPVVEFGFARMLNRKAEGSDEASVPAVRLWAHDRGEDEPEVTGGEVDWGRVGLERSELPCAYDDDPPYDAPTGASDDVRERLEFDRRWTAFEAKPALAEWDARPREPVTPIEVRYLAEAGVLAHDPRATGWLRQLAFTRPLESLALQSQWLEDDKRYAEAAGVLEQALVGYRTDPWPARAVMWRAVRVATLLAIDDPALAPRMRELLSQPFAIEMLRDQRLWAALSVSRNIEGSQACTAVLGSLEPDTPWDEWTLRNRRDCYRATRDPRMPLAEQELSSFLAKDWAPFVL